MAYTNALRDHVIVIVSDGTAGGFTFGAGKTDAEQRLRTIRWIPAAGTDTITLERVLNDLTTEVVWESSGGTSTVPQESRLDLRLTRGFKVTMTTGGKLYLYQALDGPAAK